MKISTLIWALMLWGGQVQADIYLICYATHQGKTGHSGLAIDEYQVFIKDEIKDGQIIYKEDTVATGTMRYVDFWPQDGSERKALYTEEVDPAYYFLPNYKWKGLISLKTLKDSGIPHKFHYPCDGILRIPTQPAQDLALMDYLRSEIQEDKKFHTQKYNCSDFVEQAIEEVLGISLEAKEFVVNTWSTTPNKLFREVQTLPGVITELDPGQKIHGSFMQERVLYPYKNVFMFTH